MDSDLRMAIDRIKSELLADIGFFAFCGAGVGVLTVWQHRFKELGWAKSPHWASDLFKDFVSVNVFTFIFFAYLLLACGAAILASAGSPNRRLEQFVIHIETRFVQIVSAIVSFIAGLAIFVLVYSIVRIDPGGFRLVFMSAILVLLVFGTGVMGILVGRRSAPFNHWAGALVMMVLLVGSFGWLLLQSEPTKSEAVATDCGSCSEKS